MRTFFVWSGAILKENDGIQNNFPVSYFAGTSRKVYGEDVYISENKQNFPLCCLINFAILVGSVKYTYFGFFHPDSVLYFDDPVSKNMKGMKISEMHNLLWKIPKQIVSNRKDVKIWISNILEYKGPVSFYSVQSSRKFLILNTDIIFS